ncbi:MAG: ECF-type sigma factor, partial [Halieaceae bacterium]|nr:ECF-type sigma factor [Halieaceae bacterium]
MNKAVSGFIPGDDIDGAAEAGAYSSVERDLAEQFLTEHYDTLLTIARAKRRRAGVGHTCDTLEIMHEAILRLNGRSDFRSSQHYLRACVLAMRHVIVDYARRKLTVKRGEGQLTMPLDEVEAFLPEFSETPEQLVSIARLLSDLEGENPRWLQVVDARYFSGMTETE